MKRQPPQHRILVPGKLLASIYQLATILALLWQQETNLKFVLFVRIEATA